jgi:hypothetical protein
MSCASLESLLVVSDCSFCACGEKMKGEVASPSAALSAYRFWMNYENGPKEPNQEWMQFAEAYAAHSGSQEPDWHAFYTDSETRRFAAEEKILALEKQLDSGSQPTSALPKKQGKFVVDKGQP